MTAELYDEEALKARLSRLDRQSKTAFAAACAEGLVPLHGRYWHRTGLRRDAARLRVILDAAWDVATNKTTDVRGFDVEAAAFGPTDDQVWVFDMGYAQNGSAAVAYAIRTWLSDDAQEAAWAGRQVQEAAEYSVRQLDLAPDELYWETVSEALARTAGSDDSPVMRSAVTFLNDALRICEVKPSSWEELRDLARSTGQLWAASFR